MKRLALFLATLLLAPLAQADTVTAVLAETYGTGGSNTGFIPPSELMSTLQSTAASWSGQTFDCSVNTCVNLPGSAVTGTVASATAASTATSATTATTAGSLSASPTQCSGSNVATGIQANGNANCASAYTGPTVGSPTSRTMAFATAYQATTTTHPAFVTINLTSTASLTISGGVTNTATVYMGSTSGVASGTGTAICSYSNSNTGTLVVGVSISTISTTPCSFALPAGGYFAVVLNSGSVSVTSAFDESLS